MKKLIQSGSPGVMQVMDLHSRLSASKRDIPFGKLVGGRNDQSLAAITADMIQAYRYDSPFPAFFNDDQAFDIPGQQPDMGNGEPDDGDPWGTWG